MALEARGGGAAPDDLLLLEDFNDTELLRCLRLRYERDQIYTWVGSVLVSVNPYRDIGVFSDSLAARYAEAARCPALAARLEPASRHLAGPPHLFATVASALASPGRLHALLISGESGAGKTEATRASLAFLARRCSAADRVRDRLLHSGPVLEAFGNAQTRQNNNSSRFGKFIEVHISGGKLVGATLRPYMLEASRVAGVLPRNERTYHVFYYFRAALSVLAGTLEGAPAPGGPLWEELRRAPEWQHVARAGGPALAQAARLQDGPPSSTCLEAFELLYEQLLGAGMSRAQVAECARAVAAVAALAEEPAGAGPPGAGRLAATLEDLLGIPPAQLHDFFSNVELTVGGQRESLLRGRTSAEAKTLQSSLAQELYSALFLYVARLVARGIAPPTEARGGKLLGLLDLYGFEVFDANGFEQFLINYCNERIQQLFNRQVFLSEATEYSAEGLDADGQWQRLASACRLPALALLEGEPGFAGIFGVINDRSRCGFDAGATSDGAEVVEAISAACGGHPALRRPARDACRIFGVAHFAGEVFYEARHFVHKNASSHRPDIVAFLRRHGSAFVQDLFEAGPESGARPEEAKRAGPPTSSPALTGRCCAGATGRRRLLSSTLISAFRSELGELCTALEARECRHVRCLRPNDVQAASLFDSASMLRQCRYSGLLEATRIRRFGYAHRRSLAAFAQRYAPILSELRRSAHARGLQPPPRPRSPELLTADACRPSCAAICQAMQSDGVGADEVCAGRTKIFLKEAALDWLETARARAAATCLASAARCWRARRRFLQLSRLALRAQLLCRLRRARRAKAAGAAVRLQRWWRALLARSRRQPPPPPPSAPLDEERRKAIRRAAWVTTTAVEPPPEPGAPPLSARCGGRAGACGGSCGCSVPGCAKRRSQRAGAGTGAGGPRRARREKENEAPRPGGGCPLPPRKLAEAARSAVKGPASPAAAAAGAAAGEGAAGTLALRSRAASPSARPAALAPAPRPRQALRALSPSTSSDRLQAHLLRVGRALRDKEMPQEKAVLLEGFLETLLPSCAAAPTPARGGRGEQRPRAACTLQQPPWKPVAVVAHSPGGISRCRSLAKCDLGQCTSRNSSPRRPQQRRGGDDAKRAASPPPAAAAQPPAPPPSPGPGEPAELGLSLCASTSSADAPTFGFGSVRPGSPSGSSHAAARPPAPRGGRQPLSARCAAGGPVR